MVYFYLLYSILTKKNRRDVFRAKPIFVLFYTRAGRSRVLRNASLGFATVRQTHATPPSYIGIFRGGGEGVKVVYTPVYISTEISLSAVSLSALAVRRVLYWFSNVFAHTFYVRSRGRRLDDARPLIFDRTYTKAITYASRYRVWLLFFSRDILTHLFSRLNNSCIVSHCYRTPSSQFIY